MWFSETQKALLVLVFLSARLYPFKYQGEGSNGAQPAVNKVGAGNEGQGS